MIKKTPVKKTKKVRVTFVLPGDHHYGPISLVGDFNGWDATANVFGKRSNNTYSTAVTLDTGTRSAFRYITDAGEWVNEEEADAFEETPFGSVNCIVET